MNQPKSCACESLPRLIFACSGGADVGEIDGCPVDCARKTLEAAGLNPDQYLRITDCGFVKGQAPAKPKNSHLTANKTKVF